MQHFLSGHTAILRVNAPTPAKEKRFQVSCLCSSNNSNEHPEWRSVATKKLLTDWLTPGSRGLLKKTTGFQLVKKFLAFYGTRRFIAAFTSARHVFLSWASSIQSIPSHPTSWRSILISSSHLSLDLPSCLLPSGLPTKTLYTPLLSPTHATFPTHLILLDFIIRTISGEQYKSLSSSLCSFFHSPVTSSLLAPNNPQHPILQYPQPTFLPQCEWPSFTPIQNKGKIIVLYILIFKFLDSKLEDKIFCNEC